jgi:hypothetical protein
LFSPVKRFILADLKEIVKEVGGPERVFRVARVGPSLPLGRTASSAANERSERKSLSVNPGLKRSY